MCTRHDKVRRPRGESLPDSTGRRVAEGRGASCAAAPSRLRSRGAHVARLDPPPEQQNPGWGAMNALYTQGGDGLEQWVRRAQERAQADGRGVSRPRREPCGRSPMRKVY